MALPVTIPNTFANATASIPLSQLDTNFNTLANAVNGISDGSETLANASVTVLTAGTVDINGGAIDGTTVGTSNAAAGSFTTLNTSGAVVFNDAGADVDFRVEGDTDANLLFVDAGNDKVGIGTSSPFSKLDVRSTNAGAEAFGGIFANDSTSAGSKVSLSFVTGSDGTAGRIRSQIMGDSDGSNNGYLSFYTRNSGTNTERMRITSAGAVQIANGNLVFSTNGTGIDFSASAGGGATSSLLDDYEEGTWTPTVAFGGASVGVTYSDQTGFYTKVGNLVYATCRVFLSSKGTSTGSFSVKSFPFTSVNIVNYRSGGSWAYWSGFATSYVEIAIYMQNNYNFVEFYGATAAATTLSQISDTSIQNNTNIQFTIVYQAA